jgi:hypothetical protein
MANDDSGPAHPLSLRDYFAGQALAHALSEAIQCLTQHGDDWQRHHEPIVAKAAAGRAYLIADAMLKERSLPKSFDHETQD